MNELSNAAREARNQYMRQYRRKNPEKFKVYVSQYWERKAEQMEQKTEPKPEQVEVR